MLMIQCVIHEVLLTLDTDSNSRREYSYFTLFHLISKTTLPAWYYAFYFTITVTKPQKS